VTYHVRDNQAFRLDPVTSDLDVILYTQNRTPGFAQGTVTATGIGTVRLAGPNITPTPVPVNLRDESSGSQRVGVSFDAPTTFAQLLTDPTQRGLVTDLTFDFTLPADFTQIPGTPPLEVQSLSLLAPAPGGMRNIGFALVPEPSSALLCLVAAALVTPPARARRQKSRCP
jgi:hypothetical protein